MTMKKTRQPKMSQRTQQHEPKAAQFEKQGQQQEQEQPPARRVNFYNDGSWPPGREPTHTR